MARITRILVPTDFSPPSEIAFNYAIDLARREGATLHVLHVIDEMSLAAAYPDGLFFDLPGAREELVAAAGKSLADLEAVCATARVPATSRVLVGRPATAIAAEASERGSDLIVMATHGRSGFAHLMLGSIAERVLRTAHCPVLTVRDTARISDAVAADRASRSVAVAPCMTASGSGG